MNHPPSTHPAQPIRVFLVDDHAVVRQGTREILNQDSALSVVGETASGHDLGARLLETQPDVLLLDINLPEKSGIALLEELKPRFPQLRIVLFTAHTDPQYIRKALELQADGYLSKTIAHQDLCTAIQRAYITKEPVYSPDVLEKIQELKQQEETSQLTPREYEILLLIARGETNPTIAKQLFVSVKTVDTHVANLMKKLGLHKRAQLVAYAYEQGLLHDM